MGRMHLVTGPFRPALESAFRETFAALRRDSPLGPLAVIAPSKRLSDRLKELALEAVPEGIAAVRFFNLFSFARTLYDEAAPKEFAVVLEKLVPERLVRAILRRHFEKEPYLSRAAIAPGGLLGALHELQAAGVDPGKALVAVADGELGEEDAPKLAEILSLYKRYTDELRRRRIHERADVVRIAAEHAPKSQVLGSFQHVLYYGFYDLDKPDFAGDREQATRETTDVLRRRVESRQLKEPKVNPTGDGEIVVQLPGIDADELRDYKKLIGVMGSLQIHAGAPPDLQERFAHTDPPPVGYKSVKNRDGGRILIEETAVIEGRHIVHAEPHLNERGVWVTSFELDVEGAKLFDEAAERLYRRSPRGRMVILLDGEVRSAPVVDAPAFHGRGQITTAKP